MQLNATQRPSGTVLVRKLNAVEKAPLSYTLRNRLTWRFISGWLAVFLAQLFSAFTNTVLGVRIVTMTSELSLKKRTFEHPSQNSYYMSLRSQGRFEEAEDYATRHAYWIDYGVVSRRVVTNNGVAFLVDAWDNAAVNLEDMNYHGCGTGTNAEAVGDTALQTESTTALNPDSTRATGTRAQPSANIYRSTGVLTYDASVAVTEHGLLSQAATGGGTLWDRSVFSAVNVVSGESISFQYSVTLTAGS